MGTGELMMGHGEGQISPVDKPPASDPGGRGFDSRLGRIFFGLIFHILGACLGHVWHMFGTCLGHVWVDLPNCK